VCESPAFGKGRGQIPTLPSGKFDRRALRALIADGTLPAQPALSEKEEARHNGPHVSHSHRQ